MGHEVWIWSGSACNTFTAQNKQFKEAEFEARGGLTCGISHPDFDSTSGPYGLDMVRLTFTAHNKQFKEAEFEARGGLTLGISHPDFNWGRVDVRGGASLY